MIIDSRLQHQQFFYWKSNSKCIQRPWKYFGKTRSPINLRKNHCHVPFEKNMSYLGNKFREKELIKIERKKIGQYCMSLFLSSQKWKHSFFVKSRELKLGSSCCSWNPLCEQNSCQEGKMWLTYSSKIYERSCAKPHTMLKCQKCVLSNILPYILFYSPSSEGV